MAIESMSIVKSEELGYDKQVEISFRKIIVTSTKTVGIPDSYGKSGSTMASNGAASTTQGGASAGADTSGGSSGSGDNSKSSMLYAAAAAAGIV